MQYELKHTVDLNDDVKPAQGSYVNDGYNRDDDTKQNVQKAKAQNGDLYEEMPAEEKEMGCFERYMTSLQATITNVINKNMSAISRVFIVVLVLLYFAYFAYAMTFGLDSEGDYRLLVATICFSCLALIKIIARLTKRRRRRWYKKSCLPTFKSKKVKRSLKFLKLFIEAAVFVFLVVFIVIDVAMKNPQNLMGLLGQFVFIVLFFVFSISPAKVDWHPVYLGFVLQYILALIILRQDWGYQIFKWMGDRVQEFLSYSDEGAKFVFGASYEDHLFAFKIMPIVVFFYSFINVMYYLGAVQFIVRVLGTFLSYCMGTTPAESLNAAGNIFLGMTDTPLMIKPYLNDMTRSELHAIMTGGFATIAGSVLGAYISFGVPSNHLIAASVMSAPAALAISKLTYPETEATSKSSRSFTKMEKSPERNIIEAVSNGAIAAIKLVGAITVNVIAFLSLLKLINASLTFFGNRVGIDKLTFQYICSYVFYPVAYLMGTEAADCRQVAELLGVKTFTNEFIAYEQLAKLISNKDTLSNYTSFYGNDSYWEYHGDDIYLNITGQTLVGGVISTKSEIISTYALCGFANFGSMGIMLGGLGALAPKRRSDFSQLVVRSMIAGTVACFITACIAGMFYQE